MAYNANSNRTSRNNPLHKLNQGKDAVFGIFLAEIVSTKDVSRTGRVRVFIPAISKDKNSTAGYFDAVWTSPFAGTTDPRQIGTDLQKPDNTISCYGFLGVVPDMGNLVLVCFGDGNTKYPLVISCLFGDKFNYMLPGNAGGKTYQAPNFNLPTMEKNKRTADINHNDTFRPIQHTLAEAITTQGLALDPVRGAGKSTFRRESPSEVFGILTPGPRDPDKFDYRLGGHSITLDDHLATRNIRIRTAQGNQILLDDTNGFIYIINKEGKVWMEFSQSGEVYLFAEGSINMRAKQDFNIRADYNVNIEAGQNVNIKAAADNTAGSYTGVGGGTGGEINLQSERDTNIVAGTTSGNLLATAVTGELHMNSAGDFYSTSGKNFFKNVAASDSTQAGRDSTVKAGAQITHQASNLLTLKSPAILMNSGGPDAPSVRASATATPIPTVGIEDAELEYPKYDKSSDSPLTTDGKRTGPKPTITTIVSTMVTAEPFEGHAIPDPTNDDQDNIVPDETLKKSLPAGSTGMTNAAGDPVPAADNSPSGFKNGTGYTGNGPSALPQFDFPKNVSNNFAPAQQKQLSGALQQRLTNQLSSSIPSVRNPVTTVGNSTVLGVNNKISEYTARIKRVGIDTSGIPSDLQRGDMRAFSNKIGNLQRLAKSPKEFQESLKSQGIISIRDGASNIFVDKQGRKIIDFRSGLGGASSQLLTAAKLGTTANMVTRTVGVPISDNQLSALTSFADHIGPNNFSKSSALRVLNSGNYKDVPNAMMEFTSNNVSGVTETRPDYVQRRQFEGELFQTPDGVPLPDGMSATRKSFKQQAVEIRTARDGYLTNSDIVT